MRRHSGATPETSGLSLDSLSFFLIVASIIVNFYIFTQSIEQSPTLSMKAAFIPTFAMAGLLFRPIFTGSWNFRPLSTHGMLLSLASGAVALSTIIIAAAMSPMATLEGQIFYVNMAITEEVFFNYFLFAWIASMYPWPVAALLTGLFFAPFHIGVYGMDLVFMAFAVAARIILCTVYRATGSLSSAMVAHILFNLIAVGSVLSP